MQTIILLTGIDLELAEEISIERAGEKHLYSIAAMTAHYFPYANFSHSAILGRIANPNIVYFVALEGGHTVGFIDFELKGESAQILGLAVLDEHRGKGIAKKLLQTATAEITAAGKRRIELLVAQDNEAAKGLYGRHGFAVTGKLATKLGDKDVLVLKKEL